MGSRAATRRGISRFPCQAFSIAGNRKGFEDTRGTLFFEICRIARAKRPEVLLLENVKGLLSHNEGETFRTILASLDELGYDAEWQVLNSKHWGVPQNRERVFIIASLRERSSRQVFPISREDREDSEEDGQENQLSTVHPNRPELGQADRVYDSEGLLPALNGGWTPQIAEGLGQIRYGEHDQDQLYLPSGLSSTVRGEGNAGHHLKVVEGLKTAESGEKEIDVLGNINPSGRGMNGNVYRAASDTVAPTVTTNKGEEHKIINHQMRPESRPSIQEEGQSGGSGILFNSDYSYALSSSPHFVSEQADDRGKIRVHRDDEKKSEIQGYSAFLPNADYVDVVDNHDKNLIQPCLTPGRINKSQNGRRMKEGGDPMFTLTGQDIHGVLEWKPLQRKRTDKAKEIRRKHRRKHGEDYSPMSEYKFGLKDEENVFHTVTSRPEKSHKLKKGTRIRKLTPRECWRLQGFPDWAFDRAKKVNSDTQLYKQAGNAVTVNVIEKLGRELLGFFDRESEVSEQE